MHAEHLQAGPRTPGTWSERTAPEVVEIRAITGYVRCAGPIPGCGTRGGAAGHAMFIGLTSEHKQNCRAIDGDPWWTVGRRTYGAAQDWTRPPASPDRGGYIRVDIGHSVARAAQRGSRR